MFPDLCVRREIMDLMAHCPHTDCVDIIELRNMEVNIISRSRSTDYIFISTNFFSIFIFLFHNFQLNISKLFVNLEQEEINSSFPTHSTCIYTFRTCKSGSNFVELLKQKILLNTFVLSRNEQHPLGM